MFLFKKSKKSEKVVIEVDINSIKINGTEVSFPIHLNTLIAFFGEPSLQEHDLLWRVAWNEYGVYADYGTWDNIIGVKFLIKNNNKFNYLPKQLFAGEIIVEGINISELENDAVKLNRHEVRKIKYQGEGDVLAYEIGWNPSFKEEIPTDKYLIPENTADAIEFKDFNFKLAIIQELMFNKELITPKFDLYEFVSWYQEREIDIEEEGYEPIAEVTQYFKDLPIPKTLAKEVSEIYQDGGDDIYLQLLRFGEGSEDYWDIENTEDTRNFPNLKKIILYYAKESVITELINKGIKAEIL